MADVKLICAKSFSKADREIVDRFMEFQQALIDSDLDRLDEIVLDSPEFVNLVGTQSKKEFLSQVNDETLIFSSSEILDPTILFDDENAASLISKVRLVIGINDKELRLISNSVVSFQKADEIWHISKWDS